MLLQLGPTTVFYGISAILLILLKLQEKALRYSMLDFKSSYRQLLHNCGKSTLFLQRLQKLMEVI